MQLEADQVGDVLFITITEERIDAASAARFKDAMRAATASNSGRVVLDLARVNFIDSSGLGAIVGAHKALDAQGGLELARPTEPVRKLFALTRMDSVFAVHPDREAALQATARGG